MSARRLCLQLVCLAGLVCTNPLGAQEAKIGYVDMQRLFDEAPQVQRVRDTLDREFRPRNEALLADEARLEEIEAQLAGGDNDDVGGGELLGNQRQSLTLEARNLRRSIDRRRDDLTEEVRFRTNAETNDLEDTIELAVSEVARANNYDLILTNPVAYASERVDITEAVLDWLASDLASQTEDSP